MTSSSLDIVAETPTEKEAWERVQHILRATTDLEVLGLSLEDEKNARRHPEEWEREVMRRFRCTAVWIHPDKHSQQQLPQQNCTTMEDREEMKKAFNRAFQRLMTARETVLTRLRATPPNNTATSSSFSVPSPFLSPNFADNYFDMDSFRKQNYFSFTSGKETCSYYNNNNLNGSRNSLAENGLKEGYCHNFGCLNPLKTEVEKKSNTCQRCISRSSEKI